MSSQASVCRVSTTRCASGMVRNSANRTQVGDDHGACAGRTGRRTHRPAGRARSRAAAGRPARRRGRSSAPGSRAPATVASAVVASRPSQSPRLDSAVEYQSRRNGVTRSTPRIARDRWTPAGGPAGMPPGALIEPRRPESTSGRPDVVDLLGADRRLLRLDVFGAPAIRESDTRWRIAQLSRLRRAGRAAPVSRSRAVRQLGEQLAFGYQQRRERSVDAPPPGCGQPHPDEPPVDLGSGRRVTSLRATRRSSRLVIVPDVTCVSCAQLAGGQLERFAAATQRGQHVELVRPAARARRTRPRGARPARRRAG